MAEPITTAPVSSGNDGGSFLKRELNGATFLTLEHIGHMVLVLVVTLLITAAVLTGLSLWTGAGTVGAMLMAGSPLSSMMGAGSMKFVESQIAVGIVASLIVLVPMLVLLDRRTRAEWLKRPGFASRVAYKAPVYTTLGLLVALKVTLVIQLLTTVLNSLAFIGVEGAKIGDMYLYEFLPTFIATVLVTAAAWYVFMLAKGKDMGKMFSMASALLGVGLAIALFTTAIVTLHQKPETTTPSYPGGNGGSMMETPGSGSGGSSAPSFNPDDYKDLFQY